MSQERATNLWVGRKPNPVAALRLFCLPFAGGGAAAFRPWTTLLPSYVDVCPVVYPGRELRLYEKPFTDLTEMVKACSEALLPLMDRPFAIFGYSLGGLIAFEMVRYLRRRGLPLPEHLFLAAVAAPKPGPMQRSYHKLPDPEFIDYLRNLNGTSEAVLQNPELMKILLPLLRADVTAFETYVHNVETPLECPVAAFGGVQDASISEDALANWRAHTDRAFSLQIFPGNHFFLHSAQSQLLANLTRHLDQILNNCNR